MATIKDIANAAGVSVATVSHVVNNTRFVSPELRKRVEEAIANAETPPNFVVKKKMQEKERTENKILMEKQKAIAADAGPEFYLYLTSSPFAHFDSSVEQELRKLAGEQGCELVRVSIESEGMLEFLTCSLINSSKMKGIFVTASVATEKLSEILNSVSVPVVIIGNSIPGVACDRVSTANEEGAYKATMHLIRSGHENIAILCGSEDREFNRERIEGYKRPSAIFVANLDTIYHVYNYISEHEIECPKDLSVVCFNDFSWATLINPPTTTVKQDVDQICKEAFLCIQDRIKEIQTQSEKSEAKTILLPNQLCVRRSTSGIGRGPFGERAGDISDLVLTEEEQEECQRHTFTAAMSFHYSGKSHSLLLEEGIRNIFDKFNIQIIAVVNAHFDPELQSKQLRSLKLLEPDILISIPTDTKITSQAYHEIASGKTKMIFMSNIPNGFKANDYVSCISVNERSHGRNIGRGLGENLRKMHLTNVGMMKHKSEDFYATRQRDGAAEQIIVEEFPELKICDTRTFVKAEETYELTKQMLEEHPQIEGIYVSWDAPAKYVLNALTDMGREDVIVSTGDLEYNIALNLAKGGMVKAISAQMPYEQGEAVATVAVKALLDEVVPSYIGVEPVYVDRYNLQKVWQKSYKEPLPEEIKQALNWTCLNEI